MSALEDWTLGTLDDCNTIIVPNSIQFVMSELPLGEADNCEKLQGVYLFRQIFSYSGNVLQCLLCHNKYSSRFPRDLEKHYRVVHELDVNTSRAEFSENIVFVCVPSDVNEETTVNSACRFCDSTLKTINELRDHYPNAHNKIVRLLPESEVDDIENFFYCGFCEHASADFPSHLQHMKVKHRMQTYVCSYCTYCTPRPSELKIHVEQKHFQDQSGPNLQCSVCVHGKDELTKCMLSHAVLQTGNGDFSQLDKENSIDVFLLQTKEQTGNQDFRQVDRNNSVRAFSQTKEQTGVWELPEHLKEILLDENVSDVVLKVEGQKFKCHRSILAAHSPVFSAMMTHEIKEKNTDIVDIEDVDLCVFSDFLSYLYTGNMENVTSQNVVELYTVADKYQVDKLKNVCVDYMLKNISIDNFCDFLTLSFRHEEKDLTDACTQFFMKHSLSVVLTLKWQIFLAENPVLSNKYIKQLQMAE